MTPRPALTSRASRRAVLAALAGLALPIPPTLLALFGPACSGGELAEPLAPPPGVEPPISRETALTSPAGAPSVAAAPAPEVLPERAPAPAVSAPLGVRVAARTTIAYAAPRYGSDMRGRIEPDAPFAIFELVQGTGCDEGEGWARVEHDSYVCLKHASATRATPRPQPAVPEGLIVPFIYAKAKADRDGALLAEVPRYRSKTALVMGHDPEDFLEPNHQYAFVEELQVPGHGKVLIDEDEQLVPLTGLRLEKPSEFHGRDLAARPIPEGLAAAWVVSREAELRAEPRRRSPVVGMLEYHQAVDVRPEPRQGGGGRWIEVPDALGPGASGWVEAQGVRVWAAGPALADIADDEVWVDIDLAQQTLALVRGQQPYFVTLVSSGTGHKPNTATPRGVYRIRNKLAHGPMRNRPEDAEDSPYHVEAVPWVQYFWRRFALHGSYWHDGFGHRKSHGCVNLAPLDARYVYEQTGPHVPAGWMSVHEHAGRPGSVVRVRKAQEPTPDRRTEPDEGPGDPAVLARAGE